MDQGETRFSLRTSLHKVPLIVLSRQHDRAVLRLLIRLIPGFDKSQPDTLLTYIFLTILLFLSPSSSVNLFCLTLFYLSFPLFLQISPSFVFFSLPLFLFDRSHNIYSYCFSRFISLFSVICLTISFHISVLFSHSNFIWNSWLHGRLEMSEITREIKDYRRRSYCIRKGKVGRDYLFWGQYTPYNKLKFLLQRLVTAHETNGLPDRHVSLVNLLTTFWDFTRPASQSWITFYGFKEKSVTKTVVAAAFGIQSNWLFTPYLVSDECF